MESLRRFQKLGLIFGVHFEKSSKLVHYLNNVILFNFTIYLIKESFVILYTINYNHINTICITLVFYCFYFDRLFNRQSKVAFLTKLDHLTSDSVNYRRFERIARNYILTFVGLNLMVSVEQYYNFQPQVID